MSEVKDVAGFKHKDLSQMTLAEKRVMVAQDVIERLAYDRYRTETGTYLRVHGLETTTRVLADSVGCVGCALGALMLSRLRCIPIAGSPYFRPGLDMRRAEVTDTLHDIFSEKQLRLIENAFELVSLRGFGNAEPISEEEANGAVLFGANYSESASRLRAIMQNVVENGGTFVVEPFSEPQGPGTSFLLERFRRLRDAAAGLENGCIK